MFAKAPSAIKQRYAQPIDEGSMYCDEQGRDDEQGLDVEQRDYDVQRDYGCASLV
jgi:hypothetical protein